MFCLQFRPRNNVLFTFELLRSHIETNLANAALLMCYHEQFLIDWLARHNLRWGSRQLADALNKPRKPGRPGKPGRVNRNMHDDYVKLKQHTLNVFRPHCAPLLPPPPAMDTPPPQEPHRIPAGDLFIDYFVAVDRWSYDAECIATVWSNYAAAAMEDADAIAPMLLSQHIDPATVWSLRRAAAAATDAYKYAAASALARSRYAEYAQTAWSMHTDDTIAANAANADAAMLHNLAAIAGSNLAEAARTVWANYSFHATGTGSQHAAALAANSQHAAGADAQSQIAIATATRWSQYAAAWSQYATAAAAAAEEQPPVGAAAAAEEPPVGADDDDTMLGAAAEEPPVGADDDDTMLEADDDEEHPPVVAAAATEPLLLGAGDDDTPQPLGTQLTVAGTPLSSLATKIGSQPTLGGVAASLASLSEGTESEFRLVVSADLTITLVVETTDGTVTPPALTTPPSSGGTSNDASMIWSVETTAEENSAGPLVPAAAGGNLLDQSASDMSILHDSHDATPMSFSVVEDIDEHVPYDLDEVGRLFGAERRARVLMVLTKRVSNLNVWESVATYRETVAALGYHIPLARAKNKPGKTGKCVLYMGIQPHRVVIRKGVVVDPGYIASHNSWKRQAHTWRKRLLKSLEETMMLAPEV